MSFVKYGTIIGFTQVTELPTTISGYGITDAVPSSRTITINGTTFDLSANRTFTVGSVTSVALSVPTGLTISGSPITSSGTLAITLTSGYSIPTTASQTNWDTAYTNRITSLTTTGTSGAATLIGNVLNIPQYSGGGTISLSAIGSTPNANAATLTGSVLNLQPASDSFGGVVTTGTQTFAGAKTFNGILTANGSDYHILTAVSTSAQLRLERTGTSTGLMYLGADNIGFKIFDSAFALRLTLTSGGNLGLGVTPSAWSVGKVIQVNTGGAFLYGDANAILGFNAYYSSAWKYVNSGYATYYEQGSGEHRWNIAPSGTAGNPITFTQAMTLTANNRLLINQTADTGEHLQVNGTGRFSDTLKINTSGGNILNFNRGSDTLITLYQDGTNYGYYNNGRSVSDFIINYSTGAATFSSSVTAKGDMFIWGGNAAQSGQITANSAGGGLYIAASGTNQNIRLVPSGTGIVQSIGNFDVSGTGTFSSTIKTAAPTGGTAQPWKLGSVITDSCGVPTTFAEFANTLTDKFIEVEINGVFYQIPVRIPGWC